MRRCYFAQCPNDYWDYSCSYIPEFFNLFSKREIFLYLSFFCAVYMVVIGYCYIYYSSSLVLLVHHHYIWFVC